MKLFVLVLNQVEKLNELMLQYAKEKICGATIINSTGMAREIFKSGQMEEEVSFFNSVRKYLHGEMNENSKTIFAVIREDQEQTIIRITKEIIGDFSDSDTGIMFIINLDYICGKGLEN